LTFFPEIRAGFFYIPALTRASSKRDGVAKPSGVFLYNDTDQNLSANGGTTTARGGKASMVNYIAYRSRTTHGGTAGQQTKKTPSLGTRGKLGR